jgi:hypothetical protein
MAKSPASESPLPDRDALLTKASSPIDPNETIERKFQLLRRNLGILQFLDDIGALGLAIEKNKEQLAIAGSHPGDVQRQYSALALKAVLDFLLAVDVAMPDRPEANGCREPRVLWRLLEALMEVDDREAVNPMFQPRQPDGANGKRKKRGRYKPGRYTLAVRAIAAAQLALRHERAGHRDLKSEAKAVEASLAFLGKHKPTAAAILKWRERVEPNPDPDSHELLALYRAALNYLRRFQTLDAQVASTQTAISFISAK